VAPGKRPVSSMVPTIVFAGDSVKSPVRLVVGAPGGPRIPTTVLQVIHNHIAYGADVEQAVAFGRVHHQHLPDVTQVEPFALDVTTANLLRLRGHTLEQKERWGNATVIAIDPATGVRTGAADPRGIGVALAE
jgi:gamma-glutamyltranspeptidase/glutathione hydrolase